MDDKQAAALRAKFPDETIGKLPRVWCAACRDARTKHCDAHNLVRCEVCHQRITEAHLHLDYVGHAATTDRLLQVDPDWSWAPVAHDQSGLPAFDAKGGLWITLTVCGVTRFGYGDQGKAGVKEAIGDAIRNAAMRFGVALDLWAKEDLSDSPRSAPTTPARVEPHPPAAPTTGTTRNEDELWVKPEDADTSVIDHHQRRVLFGIARGRGLTPPMVKAYLEPKIGAASTANLEQWQYDNLLLWVNEHAEVMP